MARNKNAPIVLEYSSAQRMVSLAHVGRVVIVILLLTSFRTVAPAQEPDPVVSKVLASWEKKQQDVRSFSVHVSGARMFQIGAISEVCSPPPGGKRGVFPKEPLPCKLEYSLLVDRAKDRHSLDFTKEYVVYDAQRNTGEIEKEAYHARFDGKRNGTVQDVTNWSPPGSGKADLYIATGDMRRIRFDDSLYPVFVAFGAAPFTPADYLSPGNYRFRYDPELFYVHGQGVHGGSQCEVLRTRGSKTGASNATYECWADPRLDYAVVRYSMLLNGQPKETVVIEYDQRAGIAQPRKFVGTTYHSDGKRVLHIETATIDKVEVNAETSDSMFKFEEKPGMLIKETKLAPVEEAFAPEKRFPDKRTPDPSSVSRIDSLGVPREVEINGGTERRTLRSYLNLPNMLGLVVVIAVGIAAVILLRRRQNRSACSNGAHS